MLHAAHARACGLQHGRRDERFHVFAASCTIEYRSLAMQRKVRFAPMRAYRPRVTTTYTHDADAVYWRHHTHMACWRTLLLLEKANVSRSKIEERGAGRPAVLLEISE